MKRGDVWWATLPSPVGSGPGGRRPVVVLQTNGLIQTGIRTVIVVIITTNLRRANSPGNVWLPSFDSGLPQDSVANVSQVLTVDKSLLTDFVEALPPSLLSKIEVGLKLVMGLS
jgi:mRNA interferase MazF